MQRSKSNRRIRTYDETSPSKGCPRGCGNELSYGTMTQRVRTRQFVSVDVAPGGNEWCGADERTPHTADSARRKFGSGSPAFLFEAICDELDRAVPGPLDLYQAVLIDEGQDLPPPFYRLALKTLRGPQRLSPGHGAADGAGAPPGATP